MNNKIIQLRQDLFGGITSAIVALPLALAFGVASGLGPTAGLYGAIILGFVAAALGGAPVQISGPTGPMTVVIAGLVLKYGGSPEIIFMIIVLAGIIQSLFGVFRLGAYVNYVPLPVISGFMTGIGCIILIMEILPVLGDYSTHNGLTGAIEAIPLALQNIDIPSLLLGLSTFALTILFPKKISQYIPSSLIALVIGSIIAVIYFPRLETIGEISTGMPQIVNFSISIHQFPEIMTSAFMIALLGSIDTLLTATIADKVTKGNHDSNKELIGQGIGNTLVGFLGGIPGAGATMRTMVNINAGGKTRLSGMIHAVILLLLVTSMGGLAEKIPQCVLAGLLLKVGIDIIDWDFIRKIKIYPKDKIFLMVCVLLLTVFSDLVTAIGLGLILSHMIYSRKMHKSQLSQIQYFKTDEDSIQITEGKNTNSITLKLNGHLNYSITKDLTFQLNDLLSKYTIVHLDFSDIQSVDLTVLSAFESVLKSTTTRNIIHLKIREGETQKMFQRLGLFKYVDPQNIHII